MRASVLILGMLLGTAPALAFDNEPIGFRGINWGTPIEGAIANLTLEQTKGDLTRYSRTGDQMTVGEAKLQFVGYEFYKGLFKAGTMISEPGYTQEMIATFRAQFGPGNQLNYLIQDFEWFGPQTTILLACSSIRRTCVASMSSAVLDAEDRADRAKAAAGAGKDF